MPGLAGRALAARRKNGTRATWAFEKMSFVFECLERFDAVHPYYVACLTFC